MRKIFFQLSVITVALFSAMDAFSQNISNIDSVETAEFSNEFLLKGKTGKIFVIGFNEPANYVAVRWDNGILAIGTIVEGKPFGKWFLFDKKNRFREYLLFGSDAKCILYSKKMNKKGKIISEFKVITPCF